MRNKKMLILLLCLTVILGVGCSSDNSESEADKDFFSQRPKKIVHDNFKEDIVNFYNIIEEDYKAHKVTILWSDILDEQNEFYTDFRQKYTKNELTPYENKLKFFTLTLLFREESYINNDSTTEDEFLKYLNKFKELISYEEP